MYLSWGLLSFGEEVFFEVEPQEWVIALKKVSAIWEATTYVWGRMAGFDMLHCIVVCEGSGKKHHLRWI